MSEVICIGFDEKANARVRSATQFLDIPLEFVPSSADLFDRAEDLYPRFLLVSALQIEAIESISGEVQTLRQFFPETFILVVVQKKLSSADAAFIKKSGCNYVLFENEFLTTIRLEYVLLQTVKAAYVPLKASDFKVGAEVDFLVYTIMPLNKKFLPVLQPGSTISTGRMDKINNVGELYIKRADIEKFAQFLKKYEDKSANGLISRCRAQFHSVAYAHASLLFTLTDQAEGSSYERGKELLGKCLELSKDLLTTLAVVPEPWSVLDQSTFGMIGGPDRSMMIAAMAALSSFNIDKGNPEDVMLAGLFCDLGLLDLSHEAIGKIDTEQGRIQLSTEDDSVFKKHPILSLNRLMERKMQISEQVKEIILCTHERGNRKGFPRQVSPEKIPVEASLIHFHEKVDLEYRVKFGKARESYPEVKRKVLQREHQTLENFNLVFLETIRKKDLLV